MLNYKWCEAQSSHTVNIIVIYYVSVNKAYDSLVDK